MRKTVEILVTGKVQGVFYRQSTRARARELEITGQVSNRQDSSVLIIATGTETALNELYDWCKSGPPKARVENVVMRQILFREFVQFDIVR